ncbi:hypothetical protein [Rubellicoccus peritrichatus]|uniref:Uncharacterized protein n=1 Tax=Rubellicoccus peritrichatus TaxID=3080537 RepID=A0AAQ3L5R8_9BACT|nr:hypothetical protein [Puniceicoccus sp. CR14]WOO39551.1 hypothetical protein RZN69_13085 [Puniceicoccus sp. CR14]
MRTLIVIATATILLSPLLKATNLDFTASVSYQTNNGQTTVVLKADRITNQDSNRSGTVRLELWATSAPIALTAGFSGYKLATHTIGTLNGKSSFVNVSSGTVSYSRPPSGQSWYITLVLSEFTGASINDGYTPRDEIGFGLQNSGGSTTNKTPWPTPNGTVQSGDWTPQPGDRLTIEIREINGSIVPPGTLITYVFETDTRLHTEGGSTTTVSEPQAGFTISPSSDSLDGNTQNCLLFDYDFSQYEEDSLARGNKCLFFYSENSGVFDGFDQDASGSGTARGTFTIERSTTSPSTNRWRNSAPTGGNSYFDANLGFYFTDSNSDWVYTALMGWLYPVGDYSPDLWCYSVEQNNWLYTSASLAAWHFRLQNNRWYFYDSASNALF